MPHDIEPAEPPPMTELVADTDDVQQHAADLISAGFKAVPFAGEFLSTLFAPVLGTGRFSPEALAAEINLGWMRDTVHQVNKKLDYLISVTPRDEQPTAADVAAVLRAVEDVSSKTADAKKRKLLRNALVNAFDPEMYRAGLTRRLLKIMEDLEYGDIEILGRFRTDKGWVGARNIVQGLDVGLAQSLQWHHLAKLQEHRLVAHPDEAQHSGGGSRNPAAFGISELGKHMLKLVQEPEADAGKTPEP